MKIKGILLATFSLLGISGALAQVEYDDMYFNKEDRAKLEAQRATAVAYNTSERVSKFDEEASNINPTDSYSARNVNPEYTSRAHTQIAQSDEEDYFVSNYQYNRNQLNNWNNSFNNWYNNPWHATNYYGPAISSWYTPYYGYSSWNSPWYDPYWNYNGWSSAFSFHYGSRWNYGWGGSYDYWNRPYYAWDPYYGGPAYFGGGYWNNYRYPGNIVVVTDNYAGRNTTYAKRPSRSTAVVSDRNTTRSRSTYDNSTFNRSNSSGRTTTSTRQQEYYSRYNRATQNSTYNRSSYDNQETTQFNRSRSWSGDNSNSTYSTPSGRSSSSPSYSTPSRSSYSGGTGSGTNGRTRGRN